MRCGNCNCVIEKEQDIAWIRGTAICAQCLEKGKALQKTLLKIFIVVVILVVLVPIVLMVLFVVVSGGTFFKLGQ